MQKWEYLFVKYAETGTMSLEFRASKMNGKLLPDFHGQPTIYEHVRGLGDEGWELVQETRIEQTIYLTFKRPKPQS
jgi:hypothetical protein